MTKKKTADAPGLFEQRIELTGPGDIETVYFCYGLAAALDILEAENAPLTGFQFAKALISARVQAERANMMRLNFTVASRAGVDLSTAVQFSMVGRELVISFEGSSAAQSLPHSPG